MINDLPNLIKEKVLNLSYKIDDIGRSSDKVVIFEDKYILKISSDISRLEKEYQINKFLEDKINGPKNILFLNNNNTAYYLRTCLNGYSLIHPKYISDPNLLIDALVKAVKVLRSLDSYNIPYKSEESVGDKFTHGDFCLPNIYFDNNNEFLGFIDLSGAGVGDEWLDYAWMLWSLEYNLGTYKYHNDLLNKLNIKFNEEKYNLYIPKEYRK